MDGGFNIFPHTHTHTTHTGARITQRELFALSSGTDLDGGGWGDGGGGDEPSPRRCDAMPMRHAGATRYFAFYGVHSGIGTGLSTFWIFFYCFLFFSAGFSFSCLSVFLSRFGQVKKEREQASHAFIIIIIIIIPERGWGGAERAGATCAYFWSSGGNIGDFFPPLREPVSFIPALLLCFYNLRYLNPPVLFLASGTPTHALPRPRVPFPTPPHPSLSNTQPDTPGRKERKGWYFHPSGSGGTGGLKGGRGV